ncbi:hypothetical protein PsorP6_014037 [Peronosclerospora sorghi]|uniref:Uncharacterized protein n=1 Tax=Peronosclerospora sorghi TaxID=230839 RepID=A0ACC0VHK2_9STRA|nr:hypothetical protein PsorP6_014037 [Peronosclerospora sorghi]
MKLHVAIAMVLLMSTKSTSAVVELGRAVPATAPSGPLFVRNLRAAVLPDTLKPFELEFLKQARVNFAYEEEATAWTKNVEEMLKEIWVARLKGLYPDEKFTALGLQWNDDHLFRRFAFRYWVNNVRPTPKYVFDRLFAYNEMSVAAVVKLLNAGMMDGDSQIRDLAYSVEAHMLDLWELYKCSLPEAFRVLRLNEIPDETELYANPAFVTWIEYAMRLAEKIYNPHSFSPWLVNMLNVLREEENSKDFHSLANVKEWIWGSKIPWSPEMLHLLQIMEGVHTLRYQWHKIVNPSV